MNMIQSHIHDFIKVHNSHPIRKQENRDHFPPTGKPFQMNFYPNGVEDFKEPIEEEVLFLLESEEPHSILIPFYQPRHSESIYFATF